MNLNSMVCFCSTLFVSIGFDWVGWRNDSLGTAGKPVEMVFEFETVRNFSSIIFHTNNMFSKDVAVSGQIIFLSFFFSSIFFYEGIFASFFFDGILLLFTPQSVRAMKTSLKAMKTMFCNKRVSCSLEDSLHFHSSAIFSLYKNDL